MRNFWVQKRYQCFTDHTWMLFLWGFQAWDLQEAFEKAANKKVDNTILIVRDSTATTLKGVDLESLAEYIVEQRDDRPVFPETERMSVRDQTIPPKPDLKPMPSPKSLFDNQQLKLL